MVKLSKTSKARGMDHYVIALEVSRHNDDDSELLYWSDALGWVPLGDASVFSLDDTTKLNLPLGGEWARLPGSARRK